MNPLNKLISEFIAYNYKIVDYRDKLNKEFNNGINVIPSLMNQIIITNFNNQLGKDLAEYLQIVMDEDEERNKDFEILNIGKLYESLIALDSFNIDNYIESGYFEFAIMDNSKKAKEIALKGLDMINRKTEELKILLTKIGEEEEHK